MQQLLNVFNLDIFGKCSYVTRTQAFCGSDDKTMQQLFKILEYQGHKLFVDFDI